jgi:hypothetical protein
MGGMQQYFGVEMEKRVNAAIDSGDEGRLPG